MATGRWGRGCDCGAEWGTREMKLLGELAAMRQVAQVRANVEFY